MDTQKLRYIALCATIISVLTLVQLAQADMDKDSWQSYMLCNPSDSHLQHQHNGRIVIYHGLTNYRVDSAMNSQFDRSFSMMYTGAVITDNQVEAMSDTGTSQYVVEDDRCD